jgi:GT2 family glycosyltransferase
MGIAIISICQNDDYKLTEWYHHYLEYKDSATMHIIVDNNSKVQFKDRLKELFVNSHIIERATNGGCTIAYNDGIRLALNSPHIDSIFLLGNDMKLSCEDVLMLRNILFSNDDYSMITPLVLRKDSEIVENFGCMIKTDLTLELLDVGKQYKEVLKTNKVVDAIPGGINLAKREYYERVGLQDENLFMYSDEVDTGLRSKNANYSTVATSYVHAWHQHINPKGTTQRHPYTRFLMARNKIYLAKKHFGFLFMLKTFFLLNVSFFKSILVSVIKGRFNLLIYEKYAIVGTYYGLTGIMKENKYSKAQ